MKSPAVLPPRSRVNLSFDTLNTGNIFSSLGTKVFFFFAGGRGCGVCGGGGIFFEKSPFSSTLNTVLGQHPSCSVTFFIWSGHEKTASLSVLAASPDVEMTWKLHHCLNRCNHPLLAAKDSSLVLSDFSFSFSKN